METLQSRRPRIRDRDKFNVQAIVCDWAHTEALNRLIVTLTGRLVWSTRVADVHLGAGIDLQTLGEHVRVADPHQQGELEIFIRDAAPTVTAWHYRRPNGDGGLLFKAWRIDSSPEPVVCLVFHSTGRDHRSTWADFRKAFGLTPGENRLAIGLLDGKSPDDLADEFNLSISTMRTYNKRLYEKLGVRSRGEFFRVLAPFRLA